MSHEIRKIHFNSPEFSTLLSLWDNIGGCMQSFLLKPPFYDPSSNDSIFLGLFQNTQLIGGLYVKFPKETNVRIYNFCVKSNLKRQGLGSVMLNLLESRFMELGVQKITLLATVGSFNFWKRMGFSSLDGPFEMSKLISITNI